MVLGEVFRTLKVEFLCPQCYRQVCVITARWKEHGCQCGRPVTTQLGKHPCAGERKGMQRRDGGWGGHRWGSGPPDILGLRRLSSRGSGGRKMQSRGGAGKGGWDTGGGRGHVASLVSHSHPGGQAAEAVGPELWGAALDSALQGSTLS